MRFLLLFLLVSGLVTSPSFSQDQATEKKETVAESSVDDAKSLEAPEKVDVNPVARDEEIAKRLRDILDATDWFGSPKVKVDDGVVFLTGEAREEEYKSWAADLAKSTQDVAAVVNRMTVRRKSVWDFSVAFAELRDLQEGAIQSIPIILFGIITLAISWLFAKLAAGVSRSVLKKSMPNDLLRWVASKLVMLPILIFGVYLVLRVAGLTQLALTVLGGTGLIGLVIGIAFQDIAENFLASILISVQSPFRKGDLIQIAEHEGIVQRVTTRGTTLMTPDGNLVQIPNSQIYKSTIINLTASPDRRISFDIGIGYDDSTSEAQQTVMEIIKQHSATLNEPAPKVLIESLGASTVNLQVLFWVDGAKTDWRSVRSSVMRMAKYELQKKGISMPDEAREVIFPKGVPVSMENSATTNRQSTPAENADTSGNRAAASKEVAQSNGGQSEACSNQPEEHAVSEAEGKMQSETDDLKRQANKSWLPGEGSEILIGDHT